MRSLGRGGFTDDLASAVEIDMQAIDDLARVEVARNP
jgi:hypothetical protein